jgi:hypothetical protein
MKKVTHLNSHSAKVNAASFFKRYFDQNEKWYYPGLDMAYTISTVMLILAPFLYWYGQLNFITKKFEPEAATLLYLLLVALYVAGQRVWQYRQTKALLDVVAQIQND